MATTNVPVTLETPITIKIAFQDQTKKFKLPVKDLGAHVLPDRLRSLLQLSPDQEVVVERYSDSLGSYVTLSPDQPAVYKTLFRAAKAKLKLRLKVTLVNNEASRPSRPDMSSQPDMGKAPLPRTIDTLDTLATLGGARLYDEMPLPTVSPPTETPLYAVAYSPNWTGGIKVPFAPSNYKKAAVESADSPVSPTAAKAAGATGEVPGPKASAARYPWDFDRSKQKADPLAFRPKPQQTPPQSSWSVFCNACNVSMEKEHYHCSICDNGDYDLCDACVKSGMHCLNKDHWMVKRFVKNGLVVNSTTERIGPKSKPQAEKAMPGAFMEEKQPGALQLPPSITVGAPSITFGTPSITFGAPSITFGAPCVTSEGPDRTCNCCVKVLPEKEFVTCTTCDDYDLCLACHCEDKHGHHPGHAFKAATPGTELPPVANALCKSGRNVRHCAICDGCEKFIYGVRHKCLNCPDWDYCNECMKGAKSSHPRHRFVPIYEPLSEPATSHSRHTGIFCDGPLCKDKEVLSYIEGVRYKCTVCDDTDFCANCEALPTSRHNRTHPLIKFKTPVRNVSITTINEGRDGHPGARILGDHSRTQPQPQPQVLRNPVPAPVANAATQVQTIVDMKPTPDLTPKTTKEKICIRDLLAEPVQEKMVPPVGLSRLPSLTCNPGLELPVQGFRCPVFDCRKIFKDERCLQLHNSNRHGPPAKVNVNGHQGHVVNEAESFYGVLTRASEVEATSTPVNIGKSCDDLDAQFVRDTIPDGTTVTAGHNLVQTWTLRNPGPKSWPAGCSVRHVGGDNMLNIDNTRALSSSDLADASESNVVGRTVEAGEEIDFRINLKAPIREGTAISYWRLKTADGAPFGHRLWCDIKVVRPSAQHRLSSERLKEMSYAQFPPKSPVLEKAVEAENPKADSTEAPQSEAGSSGMIFPQLDKESPAASMHDVAAVSAVAQDIVEEQSEKSSEPQLEDSAPESQILTETETETETETDGPYEEESLDGEEFFEDAESVEIRSFGSDEEFEAAFETDEEYDILDASDEEGTEV